MMTGTSVRILLLVVLTACGGIHGNHTIDGNGLWRKHDAMIEVACTVFTILDSCSTYLHTCGNICDKFRHACRHQSVGSRYFPVMCDHQTMDEVFSFLSRDIKPKNNKRKENKQTGNVMWSHLPKTPSSIVKYVMTRVNRHKLFHKMMRKIRRAILSLGDTGRVHRHVRRGEKSRERTPLTKDTFVDLSCALFTMTRSCSSQLNDCNDCEKISIICNTLSSYSRYVTSMCRHNVLYDILHLNDVSESRENLKDVDVEMFWRELLQSPVLFIENIATGMMTKGIFDTGEQVDLIDNVNTEIQSVQVAPTSSPVSRSANVATEVYSVQVAPTSSPVSRSANVATEVYSVQVAPTSSPVFRFANVASNTGSINHVAGSAMLSFVVILHNVLFLCFYFRLSL